MKSNLVIDNHLAQIVEGEDYIVFSLVDETGEHYPFLELSWKGCIALRNELINLIQEMKAAHE